MKISYAVTVCNEFIEIQRLLTFLIDRKQPQDEIVVFYDTNNGTSEVEKYLTILGNGIRRIGYHFDGHFGHMKNALTEACLGDYIFQIDADEIPNEVLMDNIHPSKHG
jgi:hypothetical protein